jgi:hypothetical protein
MLRVLHLFPPSFLQKKGGEGEIVQTAVWYMIKNPNLVCFGSNTHIGVVMKLHPPIHFSWDFENSRCGILLIVVTRKQRPYMKIGIGFSQFSYLVHNQI